MRSTIGTAGRRRAGADPDRRHVNGKISVFHLYNNNL
jgi:hypothetical protein